MPENRKVYQYTLPKKGFEFYGKEFMFVIFIKKGFLFYDKMLMLVFEEKPFFIVQLRDYCSTLSSKAFILLLLRVYCSNLIPFGSFRYSAYFKNKTIPQSRILSINIKLLKIEKSLEKIKILIFEQYFPLKVCDV